MGLARESVWISACERGIEDKRAEEEEEEERGLSLVRDI